jgi:hypothetical protein
MSIEVKFTAYHTPHSVEADLLSDTVLFRNDILERKKYEASPYSFPSLVFSVIQLNRLQNLATGEIGTNTNSTSANLRKSLSYLTERSTKNVTAKVITSIEGVAGENSLHFLKSAVKIVDFKQRKQSNLEEKDIESDSDNDEDDIIPTSVEYEEY